jgi:hypothetical protein
LIFKHVGIQFVIWLAFYACEHACLCKNMVKALQKYVYVPLTQYIRVFCSQIFEFQALQNVSTVK